MYRIWRKLLKIHLTAMATESCRKVLILNLNFPPTVCLTLPLIALYTKVQSARCALTPKSARNSKINSIPTRSIMHNAAVIVRNSFGVDVVWFFFNKLTQRIAIDITPYDFDVIISIWSRLFVPKTQRVRYFVSNDA